MRVQTVKVLCSTSDGLSQGCNQLCLLYVLRFQGLGLIFPKQQRAQGGLPVQRLSPHHLNVPRDRIFLNFFKYFFKLQEWTYTPPNQRKAF